MFRLMRGTGSVRFILIMWLALVLGCTGSRNRQSSNTKQLTTEQSDAITAALKAKHYPGPTTLEITDDGWLVTTFDLSSGLPGGSMRGFAEAALATIREAVLPFHLVKAYRVTLQMRPQGADSVKSYGSARLVEGGEVEWEIPK